MCQKATPTWKWIKTHKIKREKTAISVDELPFILCGIQYATNVTEASSPS